MSKNNSSLGINGILAILAKRDIKIHFLGVGGVGMYSLFCLAERFGISVSGSDRESSELVESLIRGGKEVYVGEHSFLPKGVGMLVYSLAISDDNTELLAAEAAGIPLVSRAELLGALMRCYQQRIGVSGTHGKSTVTAMLSSAFSGAGLMPTVLCGASLPSGSPFLGGCLDYLIYEACEYKDSFHKFSPTVSLFLNMELDHTDWFHDKAALSESFLKAMNCAELAIVNADDAALRSLLSVTRAKYITVGSDQNCDYRVAITDRRQYGISFSLFRGENRICHVTLGMLGLFNAMNAAMAAVAAIECGISPSVVEGALSSFVGIGRRLEYCGEYKGRRVYYDYAHHPTEITVGIEAVREVSPNGVTVIFSPHTYSRTKSLFSDFVRALSLADSVILTPISAIREGEDKDVSAEALADAVGGIVGTRVAEIVENIEKTKGDIIVMGAAKCDHILHALIKGEARGSLSEKEGK